jgi:hypothetical protein
MKCRICLCSDAWGCTAGCGWAAAQLCTLCVMTRARADEEPSAVGHRTVAMLVPPWPGVAGGWTHHGGGVGHHGRPSPRSASRRVEARRGAPMLSSSAPCFSPMHYKTIQHEAGT